MKQGKTLSMVQLALLTALIVMLSFIPYIGYIKIPVLAVQATTIHIPVIVGSILLGPKAGGFLGFVLSPLALIVCFLPRILTGVVPYYVYRGLQKLPKKEGPGKISLLLAGVAGSMTNTILVMGMIYLFFGSAYAAARGIAYEAVLGVILSVVGINGTIEAVVAALLAGTICLAVMKANILKTK